MSLELNIEDDGRDKTKEVSEYSESRVTEFFKDAMFNWQGDDEDDIKERKDFNCSFREYVMLMAGVKIEVILTRGEEEDSTDNEFYYYWYHKSDDEVVEILKAMIEEDNGVYEHYKALGTQEFKDLINFPFNEEVFDREIFEERAR